jgi:hypothetical protein
MSVFDGAAVVGPTLADATFKNHFFFFLSCCIFLQSSLALFKRFCSRRSLDVTFVRVGEGDLCRRGGAVRGLLCHKRLLTEASLYRFLYSLSRSTTSLQLSDVLAVVYYLISHSILIVMVQSELTMFLEMVYVAHLSDESPCTTCF